MGYSTNSGPFWVGTLVFVILGVVACLASSALAKAGRNQYLGSVSFACLRLACPPLCQRSGPLPLLGRVEDAPRATAAAQQFRMSGVRRRVHFFWRGVIGAAYCEYGQKRTVRSSFALPLVAHPFLSAV
jgi:hypothetical protein